MCVFVCVTLHTTGTHFIKLIRIDLWPCASVGKAKGLWGKLELELVTKMGMELKLKVEAFSWPCSCSLAAS